MLVAVYERPPSANGNRFAISGSGESCPAATSAGAGVAGRASGRARRNRPGSPAHALGAPSSLGGASESMHLVGIAGGRSARKRGWACAGTSLPRGDPSLGVAHHQPLARAGDAHVAETPLLLEVLRLALHALCAGRQVLLARRRGRPAATPVPWPRAGWRAPPDCPRRAPSSSSTRVQRQHRAGTRPGDRPFPFWACRCPDALEQLIERARTQRLAASREAADPLADLVAEAAAPRRARGLADPLESGHRPRTRAAIPLDELHELEHPARGPRGEILPLLGALEGLPERHLLGPGVRGDPLDGHVATIPRGGHIHDAQERSSARRPGFTQALR